MKLLDLDVLRRAKITRESFKFVTGAGFVDPVHAAAIRDDFPKIPYPGLLPVEATRSGPCVATLIEALQAPALARTMSEVFNIDLSDRPTMITVQGRCASRDGRIHTDSEAKPVTALLYFNDTWEACGGRLRLLRGLDKLDDVIAEVPPDAGTSVAFRLSDCCFHVHEPFIGDRRSVIINWMASGFAARRKILPHYLSAFVKRRFVPVTSHV